MDRKSFLAGLQVGLTLGRPEGNAAPSVTPLRGATAPLAGEPTGRRDPLIAPCAEEAENETEVNSDAS